MSPAFDSTVTNYTASTTDATNKITAVATEMNATIVLTIGDAPAANAAAATWSVGENVVNIEVTDKHVTKTYTVTVTKS